MKKIIFSAILLMMIVGNNCLADSLPVKYVNGRIKAIEQGIAQDIDNGRLKPADVERLEAEVVKIQNEVNQLKDDKTIYLNEFRKLKEQYERVIDNLEGAIPEYQKKHWALEQENQDLNTQLDSLQELLRELRAMNDMEPLRKQYRHWSELNLAAEKKLP